MVEELIVRYEVWVLGLIVFSMFFFFPFGLLSLFCRRMRRWGVISLCVSQVFFLIFLRDVYANLRGCRPWIPSFDEFFPLFLGYGDFDLNIASVPFDLDQLEFDVVFSRRGQYRFCIFTPDIQEECSTIKEQIYIRCVFVDENDVEVFSCDDNPFCLRNWSQTSLFGGGSIIDYGRFYVPDDLLYDRKYRVFVEITGDTEALRQHYPGIRFVIEKYWYL